MKFYHGGYGKKICKLTQNTVRPIVLRFSCWQRIVHGRFGAIISTPQKSKTSSKNPSLLNGFQLKPKHDGHFKSTVLIFLFGILIFLAVTGFLLFGVAKSGIEQPLPFNHRVHTENGMACSDCHQLYKEHTASGKPTLEVCSGCHSAPLGQGQSEKLLLEYIIENQEIPWKRIYRLPPDVYFSHRRHVVFGQVECQECHGNIGQTSSPPPRTLKISMKKCMECHKKRKIDNDCLACHR